jgi:hypothetical protein
MINNYQEWSLITKYRYLEDMSVFKHEVQIFIKYNNQTRNIDYSITKLLQSKCNSMFGKGVWGFTESQYKWTWFDNDFYFSEYNNAIIFIMSINNCQLSQIC